MKNHPKDQLPLPKEELAELDRIPAAAEIDDPRVEVLEINAENYDELVATRPQLL